MTDSEILDGITDIVRDALEDDTIVLSPESTASDYADWDSFKHITIVVATEVRFGVKFKTAEIESMRKVGDFISLIQKKLKAA
ncbi:MAG TPA: acyl carrier protein [Rhizomicrobium sp.]|jgi:acyl carrier protein|nr:acyl carrier protein [Rhizomicrobium sp.]